jgi:hypothetical protein
MWGMWGKRAHEQLNESINHVLNALKESFAQHNIPAPSVARGTPPLPIYLGNT